MTNYDSSSISSPEVAAVRTRSTTQKPGKEHILFQIVLVLLVLGGFVVFDRAARGNAQLIVDLGSQKRVFEGEVIRGMTVLDALNAAVVAGDIKLEFMVDEEGRTRILALDGHSADAVRRLAFWVNDNPIESARINSIEVKSRDRIIVKVE